MHMSLLDNQATPVLHEGLGPGLNLTFERITNSNLWLFRLGGNMLQFQAVEAELRWKEAYLSGIAAHLQIAHLFSIKQTPQWQWMLGGMLRQDALVDFDGIGNFPYLFVPGGCVCEGLCRIFSCPKTIGSRVLSPCQYFHGLRICPITRFHGLKAEHQMWFLPFRQVHRLASWNSYQRGRSFI